MQISKGQHLILPGAGLVGSLLGVWLSRKGFRATLLDKRPRPIAGMPIETRSINLALSHRGWKALKAVGVEVEIGKIALPMEGRVVHDAEGRTQFLPYGQQGQAIYSVSRAGLNTALNDVAEAQEGVEIIYNARACGLNFNTATVEAMVDGQNQKLQGDAVIACDGAFSAMRQVFQVSDRFDFSQHYIAHGYQEFHMEPDANGQWAMDPNGLHIWPRHSFMMIALPNPDKTFTCTLFAAWEGEENSFAALKEDGRPKAFFEQHFPDFCGLVPDFEQQAIENPVSSLLTIKCFPWNKGRSLLIGDAAHAIVPFFGQGMNAGFEDVDMLMNMLDEHAEWETLFASFATRRKPQADAIAELALANFVEMRDKVAQPDFVWQKKIEAQLHRLYPDAWVPLYTMVSFTSTPYDEAQARGWRQEQIARTIMGYPDAQNRWHDERWLRLAYESATGGE